MLSGQDLEMMLRLTLALLLGGIIGFERESVDRPAGLRTHILVALGSAGFTLVSFEAFSGQGTVRDPARVAAQVVTGVGFLGAGTIWRTQDTVRGLTTAASIWVVAACGMMAASGMYIPAVFLTALAFVSLRWGRHPSRRRRSIGEPSLISDERDDIT
jgi:putative Mg2+ transporter-C (MgtC) family protein